MAYIEVPLAAVRQIIMGKLGRNKYTGYIHVY